MPNNPTSYTSTASPSGSFKQKTLAVGMTGSNYGVGYGSLTWYNSIDSTACYALGNDSYTLGYSSQGTSKPLFWRTADLTDNAFLDIVNGLPDRVGQVRFTTFSSALSWVLNTSNYTLWKDGAPVFQNAKTANDLITAYPALYGGDGYYNVCPSADGSTFQKVYCDMTTDGGGWMLVTRSHPTTINYSGSNWGWRGNTIGGIEDFNQSYQAGWYNIWNGNTTFTSFLFGNQRTNYDNTWGPFVYKISSIDYNELINSDTQQGYSNSTIKSNTSVYGTDGYPGMQNAVGFAQTGTNNNIYYMRDCCGFSSTYGGTPTSMNTVYCGAAFYYAGPWCGGSTTTNGIYDYNSFVANGLLYGGTNQYMIFVK
jgi:hypothetical protein